MKGIQDRKTEWKIYFSDKIASLQNYGHNIFSIRNKIFGSTV